MDTKETASYLRRPPETLRQWRHRGVGPRSFRAEGRVLYRRTEVDAWLTRQEQATGAGAA